MTRPGTLDEVDHERCGLGRVCLKQHVAAVAEKVGVMETAREFLERRAGDAKPKDLLKYLRKAGLEQPVESDRR